MPPWKKTFYSAFFAQICSIMGFSAIMPFLPFYIQELGVTDERMVRIWSGIAMSAAAIMLAVFSVIWGVLADRYGRKLMVMRSMFAGTVILILMALVQNVHQLVVCRLLQGAFTGTIAASVALVASVAPPRRSGYALGMMQAAVFVGFSIGPFLGGVVADLYGYRWAAGSGAIIIFIGALVVTFGVTENFTPPPSSQEETRRNSFRSMIASAGFVMAILVMFSIRFGNTIGNPAFPLIVQEIVEPGKKLAGLTGLIVMSAGIAAAVTAGVMGRLTDRWGHKRLLVICCIWAAVASFLHLFAHSILSLYVVRILFGMAVAGMTPAVNVLILRLVPERAIGKAYGLMNSFGALGWAFGPLLGGCLAAALGLRAPFVFAAAVQLAVALLLVLCLNEHNSSDGQAETRD